MIGNNYEENPNAGYLLNHADFIGMYQKQGEIKTQLRNIYHMAVSLYHDIENDPKWRGKNKDVMVSYLHLVIQLHGSVIDEKMTSQDYGVGCNLVDEPRNAYKEAINNLQGLPEMSRCLKELEAVR